MSPTEPTAHGLRLRIARIGIDLRWSGASLDRDCTWPFYEPFVEDPEISASSSVDTHLVIRCGDLPEPDGDLVFDARPNRWRLLSSGDRYAFEIFATHPPHRRTQLASMSSDFHSGEVAIRCSRRVPNPRWSLVRLMRPFGELLMINLLAEGRGALLHALGVNDHGRGLLFVGRSGAGKTTLGELYHRFGDARILSDERVIVTRRDGRLALSGTPWPGGGFRVAPETVPLERIFFLEHGSCNALIPDRPLALYGLLFQQMFLPFWSRHGLDFAMTFADELVRLVPAHRLSFVNDASVIEFLTAHAGAAAA